MDTFYLMGQTVVGYVGVVVIIVLTIMFVWDEFIHHKW